jgi:NitT/TauT family transport system permease protein
MFYTLLIAAGQCAFYLGTAVFQWWKPYAFPNPLGIWRSLAALVEQNILFTAVWFSLRRALIGFLLSIIIGAAVGLALSRLQTLSATVKPLILGIQSLPSVCWVPFAILWFGLSENSILFVVIMGSAFSVSIAVESAIRNVNPLYIKAAMTMGAKSGSLYFRVILPASLPALLTGLKQGWSFAWRALMSAEVMSATIGLGQTLMMGRDLADINRVALIILIIILIGVLIEKFVFSLAEERALKKIGLHYPGGRKPV